MGRLQLISTALLAVAVGVMCHPAQAQQKAPAKKEGAVKPKDALNRMTFYLAKGESDACGPGCNQWIVAEGDFGKGSADRLRAILKKPGAANRPIYFHSPGGLSAEAIVIGRLMRQRGMTARVARTSPRACQNSTPQQCETAKNSDTELDAALASGPGRCSSACVYAIVGAKKREIAPGVFLGVHAGALRFDSISRDVKLTPAIKARATAAARTRLKQYLAESGIRPGLAEAAERVPHSSIRPLTREEIIQFGIDTRKASDDDWQFGPRGHSTVESGWMVDQLPFTTMLTKQIYEAGPGGAYLVSRLRFGCSSMMGRSVFFYTRQLASEAGLVPINALFGKQDLQLLPLKWPVERSGRKWDERSGTLPITFLESAATEEQLVFKEIAPTEGEKPGKEISISTRGLASALARFRNVCSQPAQLIQVL